MNIDYIVKGMERLQITEELMSNITEDVLEDLDLDCAVLDISLINIERNIWAIDLTGSCGQVIVNLENVSTVARIKEVIKTYLNDLDYYRSRNNINYFINSVPLVSG
jgi:hypothetical protein